ncbi:hypothetical protein BSK59_12925 [Paenibacillus odorifer]|uniref:hypothetical protein n=1 Tax=Paenibacillus odorifer TaxID=189426 RepID=UPI00096FB2D0|nr:hypothetical protein [Paenibacillus odorifer]OME55377.1 hypothetical protein BSK59_12925 [Paenibacillus odorifer]
MKIKYGEAKFYSEWVLNNLSLSGKHSRMRMKFSNILENKYIEFKNYHLELLKEHCNLDPLGNPIVIEADGKKVYDVIDIALFNQEYAILRNETFTIEENDENKEMLTILKKEIEDVTLELIGESAIEYELVCLLFDDIYSEEMK